MLLFIWFYTASNNRQEQISIHLMLLFITNKRIFFQINSHISIHLMLLFITPPAHTFPSSLHFNTSHVTVYHLLQVWIPADTHISIHLMLLFIDKETERNRDRQDDFNTSHVTVYRSWICPIYGL